MRNSCQVTGKKGADTNTVTISEKKPETPEIES
jgi:hypothetical protein